MSSTDRIASEFDVELHLGAQWFRTAIDQLNDNRLLVPGQVVPVTDVRVEFDEPDADLRLQIATLAGTLDVFVQAALNAAGDQLILTPRAAGMSFEPQIVPFGVLQGLQAPPVLVKRPGDDEHEPVLALLANLRIHAEPQNEPPRDLATNPVPRGHPGQTLSILPRGRGIAFGIAQAALERFANNVWHTSLRAADGSHPVPDPKTQPKRGDWRVARMSARDGTIRLVLEGHIPIDSPVIDLIPDGELTLTLKITPSVEDGVLRFAIDPDTDLDTGLLGDLFGAIGGAIVGFLIGLVTGGLFGGLVGAGVGATAGIVAVEVIEVVVEGIVQREVRAAIDGEPLPPMPVGADGVVQIATPDREEGQFDLSVLDAIPASIAIFTANPDDEFLYRRSLLVTSEYQEFTADAGGFLASGVAGFGERFQPELAAVRSFDYEGETLHSITYRRARDGREQTLPIAEVLARAAAGELKAPFRLFTGVGGDARIPEGKLVCPTLAPTQIHRRDTIVQEIEFGPGLRLAVPDAVRLQDAAAIFVTGFQLIHPREYHAYYRAKADDEISNNFEALPEFVSRA